MTTALEKFGIVKVYPEKVYGTHPDRGDDSGVVSLADADASYVEEFEGSKTIDSIKRMGKTIERPGWAPMTGLLTPEFTAKSELRFATLGDFVLDTTHWIVSTDGTNVDDITSGGGVVTLLSLGLSPAFSANSHALPGGAEWLLAAGFKIKSATAMNPGVDDGELVMVPDVFAAPSLTIENYIRIYQQGTQRYYKQTFTGARADARISCEAGQRLMVELTGNAKTHAWEDYQPVDHLATARELDPDYRDYSRAYNGMAFDNAERDLRQPATGLEAISTIYDEAGTLYAGGGLVSFEINMNNNLQVPRVMDEDGSVSEVIHNPTDPMSFSCRMNPDLVANWDIYTLAENKVPLFWDLVFTDRETASDRIEISAVIYIESITPDEADGRLVWSIQGTIGYAIQGQPFSPSAYTDAATYPHPQGGMRDLSDYEGLLQIRWITPKA